MVSHSIEDTVIAKITARKRSLFTEDLELHSIELLSLVRDSSVLVIGAAGSVGGAFVKQLAQFSPKRLHLIDISENNLVEVVRDLRCSDIALPDDFCALPVALGSIEMECYLRNFKFDYILNFSALKHVRSEKDPYSLMRMYNTNVYNVHTLLSRLAEDTCCKKFFSVSSDKAVNPYSVMGATKIFMERIHLLHAGRVPFSTARFANVAFSDGSLLHGFRLRIQKKQAIAAPTDTKRYFISHEEAGQLCLLSCFLGKNRDIYFPKLDPDAHLVPFSEIATLYLKELGYEPEVFDNEDDARNASFRLNTESKKWPCYFFTSTTTGEKPFEEFYTETDVVDTDSYKSIGVLNQHSTVESSTVLNALEKMEAIKRKTQWCKEEIVEAIHTAVPELFHVEKGRNLDQGM
ncbi:MAG: polysaccharide biosynthesis protein [Chitinispirillaceae bacterium]|nr:polysaccharide biosynthesis protein [Chitinispirillaceae bacterium]